MDDLISRQAAIDAISCDITITGRQNAELVAATMGAFADRIKALPSAQSERKRGEWRHYEGYLTCSECGTEYDDDIMTHCCDDVPKYCPNCGADMRGEQDVNIR